MFLKSICLINFRSFENFQHNFKKNLTILYGKNAVGKTNFLEGIRFLSLPKSYRAERDGDLIFFGKNFAKIIGEVETNSEAFKIDITLSKTVQEKVEKVIKIDEVVRPLSYLIGKFVSVLFSPEDVLLISGSPQLRRRYLDIILAQVDKSYYHFLLEFKKVLLSRNRLLEEIKEGQANLSELSFWDAKLIQCGVFIVKKRKELLDFINSKIGFIYAAIAKNMNLNFFLSKDQKKEENFKELKKENSLLELRYFSDVADEGFQKIGINFQKKLLQVRKRELEQGRTLLGPHHDDFIFYLGSRPLSSFGSRGEFRSAILALKILELDFLESLIGKRPILLLDDVFSELDKERRNHLLSLVQKQQTIITTTEFDFLSPEFIKKAEVIEIK